MSLILSPLNPGLARASDDSPAVYSSKQASAEQGRLLFERGQSLDKASAILSGGLEVDAASMPCASCHGIDGRGRIESGFAPTRLWWSMLTRPYEITTPSGRSHGPYSRGTLKRAITRGLDPAGNPLQPIMPRYRFSLRDLENLIAWLRLLDDPRIGETVRVGLPRAIDGPLRGPSGANAETIAAALSAINARGGVYGRPIELVEMDFDPARSGSLAELLDASDVVALVGGALPIDTDAIASRLNARDLAWIGPMSLDSVSGSGIFHLGGGLAEQAGALLDWARASSVRDRQWVIVDDGSAMMKRAAARAAHRLAQEGLTALRLQLEHSAESVAIAQEIQTPATVLLLVPPQSAGGMLKHAGAGEIQWLQPMALSSPDVVQRAGSRLRLAASVWPKPSQTRAWHELRRLAAEQDLGLDHAAARVQAIAAARVLVRVLEQAGAGATPGQLIERLEQLRDFDAGLGRSLGFAVGRRQGNLGAYVFSPTSGERPVWIEP